MPALREYTLEEIRALGIHAHHVGADGTLYVWRRDYCLRSDPRTGVTIRLSDRPGRIPDGPWHAIAVRRAAPQPNGPRERRRVR